LQFVSLISDYFTPRIRQEDEVHDEHERASPADGDKGRYRRRLYGKTGGQETWLEYPAGKTPEESAKLDP
jgi:hypothetical protein